ncbi:MAG: hypothetical protein J5950_10695 [Clostridia bacterium]|nr:hypothetical protein [Clostridia bacterium]
MKKVLSILIAMAIAVSIFGMFGLVAGAEIMDKDDIIDDGDTVVVLWDHTEVDGAVLGTDGFPIDYMLAHNFFVAGPSEVFGVAGWVGCTQDIVAFGYCVDGGEPVMSEDYKFPTQQDVINAAMTFGCEYASRFRILVDATALEGTHKYSFLCQIGDGRIFKLSISDGTELEFMYSADGTPLDPTPTPDPGESSAPMIMFRLDEEGKYAEDGIFGTQRNNIESIEFDAGKKCYVIHMENASDPSVVMLFTMLSLDNDNYIIDAATYKYMQLGIRVSNPDADTGGQIYFQTDEYAGFDEAKAVVFKFQPNDDVQFVNINMGRNKKWNGILLDTRLDPLGMCNGICDFEVYYIAFFPNEQAANDFGQSWLAQGDEIIPTLAPTPEPTETPTNAPTAEVTPVPTEIATEEVKPTEQATGKSSDGKNGVNPGVIIGIIAGVVVIAIVVAAIVISKKKKK